MQVIRSGVADIASAAIPAAADPLFGSDVGARYRDLHTQIMREKELIN